MFSVEPVRGMGDLSLMRVDDVMKSTSLGIIELRRHDAFEVISRLGANTSF